MYKSGDLSLDLDTSAMDTRENCDEVGPPVAYLPHSCVDWVIGGPEQIKAMISDLQAALAKIEKR